MKKLLALLFLISQGVTQLIFSQQVSISFNKNSAQQLYAASMLEKALLKKEYTITEVSADYNIILTINKTKAEPEAFSILPAEKKITITGGDERGLIYGCLSLAENIYNGISLKNIKPTNEKPFLPFRAIKYDLPWDTYRNGIALTQHDETCRDTVYWKAFLDMMAENRFNSLSLWNLHTYTFLIKPKNFPEASPWTDKEMKEWQLLFNTIFRMAKERAIDTYIIPFNIFVTPEFAKAHNVANNPQRDYFVNGDT